MWKLLCKFIFASKDHSEPALKASKPLQVFKVRSPWKPDVEGSNRCDQTRHKYDLYLPIDEKIERGFESVTGNHDTPFQDESWMTFCSNFSLYLQFDRSSVQARSRHLRWWRSQTLGDYRKMDYYLCDIHLDERTFRFLNDDVSLMIADLSFEKSGLLVLFIV